MRAVDPHEEIERGSMRISGSANPLFHQIDSGCHLRPKEQETQAEANYQTNPIDIHMRSSKRIAGRFQYGAAGSQKRRTGPQKGWRIEALPGTLSLNAKGKC